MSFYVTLPSNSSTNLFDNTISNFTTQLHIPIRLNGPYEVALVEFSYDHYWKVNLGKLFYIHNEKNDHNHKIFEFDIIHQEGDSIEKLVSLINKEIDNHLIQHEIEERKRIDNKILTEKEMRLYINKYMFDKEMLDLEKPIPFLKFNNENYQLEINTLTKNDMIKLEGIIVDILGLVRKPFLNKHISPVNIDRKYQNGIFAINNLYIYSDIIKYQYIGDTLSPLLRTINIKFNHILSTESVTYDSPHYIPINKSSIDTINIKIKDEFGNSIRFERGKSIVKLHFRPINYGF